MPATDTATPGSTLLDLRAAGIATVRGLSPLAGLALTVELRTPF